MHRIILVALAAAACQSAPKEVPESRVDVKTSPEYGQVRPVTIAVLPVKAPRADIRIGVRQEIYRMLPEKKYSPFKLKEVDAHVDGKGRFAADNLDWDATFEVVVDRWTPVSGTNYWSGTGRAVMTHKTGEVLWACDFENYTFRLPSQHGVTDQEEGAKQIAYFLVGSEDGRSRLPDCPPPAGP
jgi:hypothetical protein